MLAGASQKIAKATVDEEELGPEHVALIEAALQGPVEAAKRKKELEKQRRAGPPPPAP